MRTHFLHTPTALMELNNRPLHLPRRLTCLAFGRFMHLVSIG